MPSLASFFVTPIRITVPNELTSEAELLKFLAVSTAELKKIWWFRSRMYQKFEISKGEGKKRVISAPDRRLKMLQTKIASSLAPIAFRLAARAAYPTAMLLWKAFKFRPYPDAA